MQDMDKGCRIMLSTAPCFIAFPQCSIAQESVSAPKISSICKSECDALFKLCESSIYKTRTTVPAYYQQLVSIIQHLDLGNDFSSDMCNKFNETDCTKFDAVTLYEKLNRNVTNECYYENDNGINYGGTVSSFSTGSYCTTWGAMESYRGLNEFTRASIAYAELYEAVNYCRNPIVPGTGLRREKPWCPINATHWEYCQVIISN